MSNLVRFPEASHVYQHSEVQLDHDLGAAILNMAPQPRPSFTPALLADIEAFQQEVADRIRQQQAQGRTPDIRYTVLASNLEGIYNFGGDLNRFVELIRAGDRQGLLDYALACVRAGHQFSVGLDLPVTSLALIEGRAQGGGFEAALSCNVLIAERGTQMGFPEVLFNLFPGMGAYSYLSRRIAPSLAERMILSGRLYEAEELYEMGAVDVLAEPGEGRETLAEYIREAEKHNSVHGLLRRIHSAHNRVPFEELRDITELWVDSALRLSERELRTMERLVRAQDRRISVDANQAR
ncbi:crotonase/enoyl-CoA hydratase family protein [Thiohalorhabdus methylotrophus]|uniref:Crotonase/enoyl-CoA hydratase family protein n=1 Tax=Thiohalorhabdus methylotrophus TaxID=3242694 RepID=A0ABV4TPY4_9GAMM